MDETDYPQNPVELLIILAMISDAEIPIQTIAPKFTGRFNKGVDYVGNIPQFTREFNEDLAAIDYAVTAYGLPANLKLSVHSGSDKFSIYRPIHEAVMKFGRWGTSENRWHDVARRGDWFGRGRRLRP